MRYLVLASDYDGTLAHDGAVDEPTLDAVERLRSSGRKLVLVTGRELTELREVFPQVDLCERVVAENGAVLYNPQTKETRRLADRPPDSFVDDLRRRGVTNMSVGEVIVALWRPQEKEALDAIRDAGLELQIIFNKDAVMILPAGVNKMSGLCAALEDLKISRHNVVGVGDAENDHAFLDSCECSVAVANAIPSLKEKAALVTSGARGAGVSELIDRLIASDLADVDVSSRRCVRFGKKDGRQVTLPQYGHNVLVCGQSGSGKSTFVTALVEQMIAQKYQLCLVDPEGDYEALEGCRTVGDEKRAPTVDELMQVLDDPGTPVVLNLVGVPAADRAAVFLSFASSVQDLRARTGRPHWLVVDEAHHVLPSEWAPAKEEWSGQYCNVMLITVHPEHTATVALRNVDTVAVVGSEPKKLFEEFAKAVGAELPSIPDSDLERGHAAVWFRDRGELVFDLEAEPSRSEHHRHKRKYAEGQLEEERMFRFRGPEGKLNLAARNLQTFLDLAQGLDEETWQFHRKCGDYSRWFRDQLKDEETADKVEAVEKDDGLNADDSRQKVKEIVQEKYTAPV